MKTLIVLTFYAPHWTGITEHARRLAEGLAAEEHASVSVLATNHTGSLPKKEVINKVTVHRLPVLFRVSRTVISVAWLWRTLPMILSHDVVLIYMPFAEVLFVALLAKLCRKRLVLLHNGDLILPRGVLNTFVQTVFDITGYLSAWLATVLIAYSDDYARHSRLLKPFLLKTVAIFPLFPRTPKRKDRALVHLSKHRRPIIGFAGRFVEEKGFDILLAAIPQVLRKHPTATFLYAGKLHMEYEDFFEKHQELYDSVSHAIVSLGLLPQNAMSSFYDSIDIFVMPSRSECMGLVQVEALLAGVPVVVSNIPGARVPIEQTEMGVLVPPEDPVALAQGILTAIEQRDFFRKRHAKVKMVFAYQVTLEQYKKVLYG